MTDEERKALVQTVRLEAELNANYDQTVFRMLHRIGHALEADGKRIAELEAALAARDAEIAALRKEVEALRAEMARPTK